MHFLWKPTLLFCGIKTWFLYAITKRRRKKVLEIQFKNISFVPVKILLKMQPFSGVVLVLLMFGSSLSQDIFDLTTRLDDPRFRFLFHGFRNLVFNSIGKTGQKTQGSFLQEKFPDSASFPCDISIGKSKARPNSVHKLRPGGNLFWPDDLNMFQANGRAIMFMK